MSPSSAIVAVWLALSVVITVTDAKRVVIFPMPFTSHTKYQTNIARALSKLGHEVWLTMPHYLMIKRVLDTTNMTTIEYFSPVHTEEEMMKGFRDRYFAGEGSEDWDGFFKLGITHSDRLLRNDTFFRQIQNIKPDLIIIDNIPIIKMLAIIPYRLGIPFTFVGSAYDPISQRIPFAPAIDPIPLFAFKDRMHMTFGQRMLNCLVHMMAAMYDPSVYPDAVSRYAPEMPYLPMDMLVNRAELWLVENDHVIDYPRSSIPNVKLIGGTATGPTQPLQPPYKEFMDTSLEGVVIVSFGSYILNLPEDISNKIFSVLMKIPMKSVFRSNLTSPDPKKILTSSWIPQNDLMGHANTKVFVSHSGKNGQYEALFHAIPVVSVPIFADQPHNAERMRAKGFGELIDIRTVSAADLKDVIIKVATNKSYKQAISKASEIFHIEFGVPMDRAAFWLDHVMKYGGDHMRFAGQAMPFYKYIGLDVFLCFAAILFIVSSLMLLCCYQTLRCMFCVQRNEKRKSD